MITFEVMIGSKLEKVTFSSCCRVLAGSDNARRLMRGIVEVGGWLSQHGPIERYYALTAIARHGGRVLEFDNEIEPDIAY